MSENNDNGQFKRVIGLFGGISLVAGMTIGSGVYYLGSYVLERTGFSFGWALVCWIIGGVVSILGGLCFAELGAERPVAGGMTVYLSEAYHPALGFVNAFSCFILTCSGSIASLAMAAVTGLKGTFGLSEVEVKIWAIAIIVFFTAINLIGAKYGVILQNISMVLRVIPLILIIFVGIFMGDQSVDLSLAPSGTSAAGGGLSGMISMIAFATFASLWAYEGWENLNTVGEEIKNPRKNLPLAIIISLLFITAVYVLFQFALYRVLPADVIKSMVGSGDIYVGNAVAEKLMGRFGYIIVLAGMTIGILGTTNGDVLVFPRTYYAMAEEGYFPKMFTRISKRTGVPVPATIASSAVAIILVVFNSLQDLTDMLITLSALLNVLCMAAVIIYRVKWPKMERPYKVWGGIPTVVVTVILFAVLLVNEFVSDPRSAFIGFAIPLVGLVFYFYFKKKNGGKEFNGENIE